jgi:hypothetical protein
MDKLKRIGVALLLLSQLAIAQELKITTTPPIVLESFLNRETSYDPVVIGQDTKARTCPPTYKVYIRVEGKKPWDDNLYAIQTGTKVLIPPDKIFSYLIVCMKLEVVK